MVTRSGIWSLKEVRTAVADARYPTSIKAYVLVVAGGGSGGNNIGSGGGGGGVLYGEEVPLVGNFVHTVTVGAGAPGGGSVINGSDSSIVLPEGTFTAFGGGAGNNWGSEPRPGADGGSGGGDASDLRGQASGYKSNAWGLSTQTSQGYFTGYGNRGGSASTSGQTDMLMGGGGGAGQVGQDGNPATQAGGNGGNGITLLGATYAGGGGANNYNGLLGGSGGSGGGGNSGQTPASDGTANLGGGGGGASYVTFAAGFGGSGIVIVQYLDTYPPATVSGSPTYTVSGGFRKYTFTGNGSILFT